MDSIVPSFILATAISSQGQAVLEIEKKFWDCEFAAVHGFVDPDTGADCSENYEAMKKNKFHGNFKQFLIWWQTNKNREIAVRKSLTEPQRGQHRP